MKASRVWISILVFAAGCASSRALLKPGRPATDLKVLDLTTVQLTQAVGPELAQTAEGPWQWRGRNALGSGPQSFIPPLFLGGDEILMTTLGGGIGVYNIRTGNRKWEVPVVIGVASQPFVQGSSVYSAGMDGMVRKIRLDTGAVEWTSRLPVESMGGINGSLGFIYVTTDDDTLWALDEKTGQSRWSYKRPGPQGSVFWSLRGNSVPVLSADGAKIYVGFSDGVFVSLEASSGQTLWERNFERSGRFKDADQLAQLSSDGSLVFVPLVDGDLLALKTSNGTTAWSVPEAGANAPAIDETEGFLYAATNNGAVQKISLKDSKMVWSTDLKSGLPLKPVVVGARHIAVVTTGGTLFFLDRSTGQTVDQRLVGDGNVAPPVFDGRRLLVVSARNRLLQFAVEETKVKGTARN